jgi:hypothetical protein
MTTNKFIVERTVVGEDNTTVAITYTDVAGLSFYGKAGEVYKFHAKVVYDVNATSTGVNFSVNGPTASVISYRSEVPTSATAEAVNFGNAYDLPAAAQTTGSAFTADNIAIVEGVISPSADGTIVIRGIREDAVSATCTVQGASSVLTWSRIDWPVEA